MFLCRAQSSSLEALASNCRLNVVYDCLRGRQRSSRRRTSPKLEEVSVGYACVKKATDHIDVLVDQMVMRRGWMWMMCEVER